MLLTVGTAPWMAPGVASAASRPDLGVRAVADPVPQGRPGSYGLRLRATVANDGRVTAKATRLRFVLSKDRRVDANDTRLPSVRTKRLGAGASHAVRQRWRVPDRVKAGIYRVIACADAKDAVAERDETDNCRVAKETVAVTEPGGSTTARAGGIAPGATAAATSPKREWFPEPERDDLKVSASFGCPASLHGQGDSRCVWVQTPSRLRYLSDGADGARQRSDFWYCPEGYGFPFEVALGFDPMWTDDGVNSDAFVETVAARAWTLYRSIVGREYYPSYGAPSERRGYVSIAFSGELDPPFGGRAHWFHRASYLCSSTRATSMMR